MNIFIVSQGQDIGGQNARIVRAFRKHEPKWTVHSMHVQRTYIQYPYDLQWDVALARKLYAEADVVHHQNRLFGYAMYDTDGKPSVVTHHGPPLRGNADAMNAEARSIGAVQTVSTVDLLADAPHAAWTPCFYDIADMGRRYPRRHAKKLRIGHHPTVRDAKGTDEIERIINRLSLRHDFEYERLEGQTWSRSLSAKSRCDIYVDQLTLGYGLSAIESMAMGVPVISGWAEPADHALFLRETGLSETPFLHTTEATFERDLESLIRSADLREEVGKRGKAFAREFHDERKGLAQLIGIYESAQPTSGVEALELYSTEQTKADVLRKWAAA